SVLLVVQQHYNRHEADHRGKRNAPEPCERVAQERRSQHVRERRNAQKAWRQAPILVNALQACRREKVNNGADGKDRRNRPCNQCGKDNRIHTPSVARKTRRYRSRVIYVSTAKQSRTAEGRARNSAMRGAQATASLPREVLVTAFFFSAAGHAASAISTTSLSCFAVAPAAACIAMPFAIATR